MFEFVFIFLKFVYRFREVYKFVCLEESCVGDVGGYIGED